MSHTQPPCRTAAPDRIFHRTAGLLLGTAVALVLAGGAAQEVLTRRAEARHALALIAAQEAAALEAVRARLVDLAGAEPGAETRTLRVALGWSAERAAALALRRGAAAPGDGTAALDAAQVAAVGRQAERAGMTAAEAATGARLFAAEIAPAAERRATAASLAAEAARRDAWRLRLGVLAAQIAALLGAGAALAGPARRRIAEWVLASSEADRENRFRLLHDPLTELPNATYLKAHLDQIAAGAARATRHTAILRLDLDRFRTLRETLGTRAAEEILRITARRLRKGLRGGDFAAYLGQDDFVLVAGGLEDAQAAGVIAQRLQGALAAPFSLQGGARRVGCSIGVTLLSDDLPEAERALANAEIALAEAQETGPSNIRWFSESLRAEASRRAKIFAEMLAGLDRGEFVPFFQPQIDLATGGFSGFEALVRWRHPDHGLLAPGAFLDFAEAADLTERMGETVLAQSLAALTAWDAAGLSVPKVGVNFAMAQLRDPRLIEKIKWEVERHDVEPSRVAIEVLETVLIKSDEDLMVRNLRGLASAGFQVELDDFGTGHASIQNLRRLMVHRIKIDRSFVLGIEASAEQRTLTASMIAMARALGIRTLAEGVETPQAAVALRSLGCDHAQGFAIARPMSREETFGWLQGFVGFRPVETAAEAEAPRARP
jgi:diguanylate cyclase (GGDEF)-like protein